MTGRDQLLPGRWHRLRQWLLRRALSWFFLFMAVMGGLAIIVLTGRHLRLCGPLLVAYEALIVWTARSCRQRFAAALTGAA
jgi:hypothetical protein